MEGRREKERIRQNDLFRGEKYTNNKYLEPHMSMLILGNFNTKIDIRRELHDNLFKERITDASRPI